MTRSDGGGPPRSAPPPAGPATRRVLLVGAAGALPDLLPGLTASAVTVTPFSRLNAALLARIRPDAVLAPLFGADFDIAELAERLTACGYRGALRAYTRPLPAPRVVKAEIRAAFPRLDFDLILLG